MQLKLIVFFIKHVQKFYEITVKPRVIGGDAMTATPVFGLCTICVYRHISALFTVRKYFGTKFQIRWTLVTSNVIFDHVNLMRLTQKL